VSGDPFAEQTTCKVTAPGMDYGHGVLTVRLGAGADTFEAVYRIDNGPLIKAGADTLAIARRGLAVYQDDLASPSGGIVRIPGERLLGAREVRIELRRGGAVFTRRLSGLDSALVAAQSYRCEGVGVIAPAPG
jgi:hypothetical protein